MLYSLDEVARRVGLARSTLHKYCNGRVDLVRGKDFILWRNGPHVWRKQLMFTDRGLERLALRQYHFRPWKAPALVYEPKDPGRPRLRLKGPRGERIAQLRAVLYDALWRYQETPCAHPGCPCVIHKLGVPQADVVQIIMKRDGYVDAFGKFHKFEEERK